MKIELSHDILAKKIYDMASAEDKMHVKIRNFVANRYVYYKDARVLLDQKALDYIAPYIYKINLEQAELDFITKSKLNSTIKQYAFRIAVAITFSILLVSGYYAAQTFKDLYHRDKDAKSRIAEMVEKKKQRKEAEERAQRLLEQTGNMSQSDLKDTNIVKQLIIQYDTLSQQQERIRQQRDLAQSATLSDLANTALKQDKNYAFQLAAKSWELNKENKQALDVLEKLSNEGKPFTDVSPDAIQKIIENNKVGNLKDKDLKAIFSSENTVVQQTHSTTKNQKVRDQVKICTKKMKNNPLQINTDNPTFAKIIQQQITNSNPTIKKTVKIPVTNQQVVSNDKIPNKTTGMFQHSVMVGDMDCIKVKHLVGQWVTIQDSRGKALYYFYNNNGGLSFQFSENQDLGFYELVFYTQKGEKHAAKLITKTNVLGKINYIVEMSDKVEELLQKELISNWTFVSKNKNNTKKANLMKAAQTQFLNLSKCLL